jgi:hypothetical protein
MRRVPFQMPNYQQLLGLPWSQMEGLRGALEWQGLQPLQDIWHQAELMRPRTPMGVNYARWSPYQQI